jgi:hypothetical protein
MKTEHNAKIVLGYALQRHNLGMFLKIYNYIDK